MSFKKTVDLNSDRLRRSRIFYFLLFLFFFVIGGFLILALKSLVLPTLVGMLSAYLCIPLLNILRRKGIPKGASLLILFGGFVFILFFLGKQIVDILPDEKEKLELRVQIQYKVNEQYLAFTGRDDFDSEGNIIHSIFGEELQPVIENLNDFIALTREERELFNLYSDPIQYADPIDKRVIGYFEEVSKLPYPIESEETKVESEDDGPFGLAPNVELMAGDSKIAKLIDALSTWIVLPFVFIFLLVDDGNIKKFLIDLMPNRYFEMSLTILDNVDDAIGNYLRGTLMQCSLVGLSFFVGLMVIGFDFDAAALIGILAGVANAIPFLGPVLGLGIGLVYAMIVEDINSILPFLSFDPIIGVLFVVLVVQVLDNTIFQPMVLGKAVNLHPLVVVLGVTGGSIIFGFVGMLFAIPTIVVFKVIIATIYKQLKLYYIIY
ncbi:MAG: AI-2E family transporter [Melioribacteraceae bacterium]|nr:AI-2E family transporter [Melioribacteraceae bacterium]MCF8412889.1 AI-2E family transporter [Melioribacteraceae bacterium]